MTDALIEEEDLEPPHHDYLVKETREIVVTAPSAAEARKAAELIFRLSPNNKLITTTVNVEKVRK